MTAPDPQHPLDVLGTIAAEVLSDIEMTEQFTANDFAATLNQAGGRQIVTAGDVLRLARTPPELEPGPDIEIPPDALHSFGEVFGDKDEPSHGHD
jgi:hypothetical protein